MHRFVFFFVSFPIVDCCCFFSVRFFFFEVKIRWMQRLIRLRLGASRMVLLAKVQNSYRPYQWLRINAKRMKEKTRVARLPNRDIFCFSRFQSKKKKTGLAFQLFFIQAPQLIHTHTNQANRKRANK